jgi:hypothetical protein
VVLTGSIRVDERPARDRAPVEGSDQDLLLVAGQRLQPFGSRLLAVGLTSAAENRGTTLVLGEGEVDVDQRLDLVGVGVSDLKTVRHLHVKSGGQLLDRMGVLVAEAQAPPGID